MRLPIYLLFFLFTFSVVSCSDTDDSSSDQDEEMTIDDGILTDDSEIVNLEALVLEDVPYGTNSQQTYDMYLPAGRSEDETKTILLIHGGGWIQGDKADMNEFVTLLQQTHPNHAIVNMNYVLAQVPAIPAFPNQFLDIQRVIDQLKENEEALNFKAELGIIGTSAGAHLGLVYDYSYDVNDDVKFVVDIVGPTDFDDPFYANDPLFNAFISAMVDESAYENTPDVIAAISPAQLVTQSSSPTLLIYGNQDPIVPLTNGQRLETSLGNADVTHQFNIYDAGHGDFDEASIIDISIKISGYINSYLAVED